MRELLDFQEINYNRVPYQIAQRISGYKYNRGYFFIKLDEYYYAAVFLGERRTGGYAVKVQSVALDGSIIDIIVKEIVPSKNVFVIQALTYPFTIVRFRLSEPIDIDVHFNVRDNLGRKFDSASAVRKGYI